MKRTFIFMGLFALSACGSDVSSVDLGETNIKVNIGVQAGSDLATDEVVTCSSTPRGRCRDVLANTASTSNHPFQKVSVELSATETVALEWNNIGCHEGTFEIAINCVSVSSLGDRNWLTDPSRLSVPVAEQGTAEEDVVAFLQGSSTVIIGGSCDNLTEQTTFAVDSLGDGTVGLDKEANDVENYVDVCSDVDAFNIERSQLNTSIGSAKEVRGSLKSCMDIVGSADPDFDAANTAHGNLDGGIISADEVLFVSSDATNACFVGGLDPIDLPGVTADAVNAEQLLTADVDALTTAANGLWNNQAVCGSAGDQVCTPGMVEGLKAELYNLRSDCNVAIVAIDDTVDIAINDPRSVCGDAEDEVCDPTSTQVVDALAAAERCRQAITDSYLVEGDTENILFDYSQMGELVMTVFDTSFVNVPGATVTATYGGDVRVGVTDAEGVTVIRLPPNQPYSVSVEATGFQPYLLPVPQQLAATATKPYGVMISPLP